MSHRNRMDELREELKKDVVALFEGDKAAADHWLCSSARELGNRPPFSLMGTELGIRKIRQALNKVNISKSNSN